MERVDADDDLLRYNSLPPFFPHTLDLPEDYYRRAGVSRRHDRDRLDVDAVRAGDLIYVKTDGLRAFAGVLPRIDVPFGLVTGISDITPLDFKGLLDDPRLLSWSGANLPLWSEKVFQVPIGFAERERPYGNRATILAAAGGRPWAEREIDILSTWMSDTAPERREIPEAGVHRETRRLDYADYLAALGDARYVICPRGNGLDTLRFWETLLVGAVPIVKSGPLDPLFRACGAIVVDDWGDLVAAARANENGAAYRERTPASFATGEGLFFSRTWAGRIRRHHAGRAAAVGLDLGQP